MTRKRALLVPLGLLALAASARAVPPAWTPLGPFGGTVSALLIDPAHPATLYAAGAFPAIVKSTDAGLSWTVLPGSPDGAVMALDPRSPSVLYASTFPGTVQATIVKSTDGGGHWTTPAPGFRFFGVAQALAVDPARPRRIYLGTSGFGLWKSEDGGASWTQASRGLPAGGLSNVTALAAAARPAGTAYAGTAALAVFKTTNGGASWTPASSGLPGGRVLALAIAPSDPRTLYVSLPQGIFRTTNGGTSWTPAGVPAPSPITALAVDPRSAQTVWAGGPDGLFRTGNGGARWHAVEAFPYPAVTALAVDGTQAAAVYAGVPVQGTGPGGVLRSADGGATWQSRRRGIPGLDTLSVDADPRDPDLLAAGTAGQGLFLRAEAGGNWTRSSLGFPSSSGTVPAIPRVLFSPAGALESLSAVLGPAVAVSTDRGEQWPLFFLGTTQGLTLLSQDPAAPFNLFAANSAGLWSSFLDSWFSRALPCDCVFSYLAVASRPDSRTPVVYLFDGVRSDLTVSAFRSDDGGASWVDLGGHLPADNPVGAVAVDPLDPQVVYVGFGGRNLSPPPGGLWKTTDGGMSWEPAGDVVKLGAVTALLVSPLAGRLHLANDAGEVFRSDDGGATWSPLGNGLAVSTVHQLALAPDDPRHVYAATSGGVWEIEDSE